MKKQRTFVIFDDGVGRAMVVGDIDQALAYIKMMLEEMENDSGMELEIHRQDMTEAELEALPVA